MLTVRLRRVECWAPEDFGSRPHAECSRAARSFNRPIASIAAGKFVGGFCFVGFPLHFVYAFAHAGGLFRVRVCLLSRAFRARRAAAHSSKLCPAHAFAIWPAIARAAVRTARGMGGSLSGYKHQKRDCGGAHAGLSSLGAHNSGCFGDFAGVR